MAVSKQSRKLTRDATRRFTTTRWSVVLAAADDKAPTRAREALAALCVTYWYPLYAYVRRQGNTADDAQDLTQEFFLRLFEKESLQHVERDRGRFRSYLLGAMKHFLSDQWDRNTAEKRGGGKLHASLDFRDAENRYSIEPAKGLTPEQIYERRWTLTVLDNVLSRLQNEYTGSGKARLFDRLKGFLTASDKDDSMGKAASELGMTEGAVKVATHRMRRRYGQLLQDEIAETVATPEDVEDEIRHLFEALC
jgi:RNA polymerase sigma factor (sigma-70 family)